MNARLDEIEARAAAAVERYEAGYDMDVDPALDVPALVAALRAVLDGRPNHADVCRCGSCSQYKRTVVAITAAMDAS